MMNALTYTSVNAARHTQRTSGELWKADRLFFVNEDRRHAFVDDEILTLKRFEAAEAWLADLRTGAITVKDETSVLESDAPRTANGDEEIARAFSVSKATIYYWKKNGAPIETGKKSDLRAIERWRQAREAERNDGVSKKTSNYYLTAMKGFLNWMVKYRRMLDNPLSPLTGQSTEGENARERRALEPDELSRLLKATKEGPKYRNLSGQDREALYLTAAYTGLRAGELASLKPGSFNLEAFPQTVMVEAAYSKRRRLDTLPLKKDFAECLAEWLASKPTGALLWPGTWKDRAAEMLRRDLDTARDTWLAEANSISERQRREDSDFLNFEDEAGRVFDFHAFRHHFITNLAKSGVHPKAAQSLARHSTFHLTFDLYSHLSLLDMEGALDLLPDVPSREAQVEVLKATGTDDSLIRVLGHSLGEPMAPRGMGLAMSGNGGVKPTDPQNAPRAAEDAVNDLPGGSSDDGPYWTRTSNQGIMSPLLCRLS